MRARDLYTGMRFKLAEEGPAYEVRRTEDLDVDDRWMRVWVKGKKHPLQIPKLRAVLTVEE